MRSCVVNWCAARATEGEHCSIHATNPDLRPQPLAADEELVDAGTKCLDCDGDGDCQTCDGNGECDGGRSACYECGAQTSHDCAKCEGTGQCQSCHGEGRVMFKKKADVA